MRTQTDVFDDVPVIETGQEMKGEGQGDDHDNAKEKKTQRLIDIAAHDFLACKENGDGDEGHIGDDIRLECEEHRDNEEGTPEPSCFFDPEADKTHR